MYELSPGDADQLYRRLAFLRASWLVSKVSSDLAPFEFMMRAARRFNPKIKIAVIGPLDEPDIAERCLRRGARVCLVRGSRRERLTDSIRFADQLGVAIVDSYYANMAAAHQTLLASQAVALSRRERQVLAGMLSGLHNNEIATAMGVSVRTIEFHVTNLFDKLGVRSRFEVIRIAVDLEF